MKWAIIFFINTGVWMTKFFKTNKPGKNNCFLINPLEFNLNLDNLIPSEKKVWTWKIFWVCHLEKGKLCKFTPWKNMPWDRNPWKKSQSRDTLDFYVHTYPCMDKKWNSLILGYSRKKNGGGRDWGIFHFWLYPYWKFQTKQSSNPGNSKKIVE